MTTLAEKIETTIADLEAQGLPVSANGVHRLVGGNREQVLSYMRQRQAGTALATEPVPDASAVPAAVTPLARMQAEARDHLAWAQAAQAAQANRLAQEEERGARETAELATLNGEIDRLIRHALVLRERATLGFRCADDAAQAQRIAAALDHHRDQWRFLVHSLERAPETLALLRKGLQNATTELEQAERWVWASDHCLDLFEELAKAHDGCDRAEDPEDVQGYEALIAMIERRIQDAIRAHEALPEAPVPAHA